MALGSVSQRGKRPKGNEDRVYGATLNQNQYYFVGIADGHSGSEVSEATATRSETYITKHLKEGASPAEALTQGMLDLNLALLDEWRGGHGGCCATWLLIDPVKQHVTVANAGDCRLVEFSGNEVLNVTNDHDELNSEENARVKKLGGFFKDSYMLHMLQPTRAVGDFEVRAVGESIRRHTRLLYIDMAKDAIRQAKPLDLMPSPMPEIHEINLDEVMQRAADTTKDIIPGERVPGLLCLGTDGLFDTHGRNPDLAKNVRQVLRAVAAPENEAEVLDISKWTDDRWDNAVKVVADELVKAAYMDAYNKDDISCQFMAFFRK